MNHLTLLNLEWPSPLDPNKDPDLTAAEMKTITEFSCLDVKCTKPSDRHIVLAAIEQSAGALHYATDFVKADPEIIAAAQQAQRGAPIHFRGCRCCG